ncbi:MAG: helix-turn-helix transcriptional regulator [Oligoflexia bacterium]|nr:helix-turn-helix transcriptional regulator [Oligoflexia bacterium]
MPLSSLFYALGDPVRLKIVQTLIEQNEISCGECKSPLSKSTMSHHFKVLQQVGLIQRRGEGTSHYLSLRRAEIDRRLPGLLEALQRATHPL